MDPGRPPKTRNIEIPKNPYKQPFGDAHVKTQISSVLLGYFKSCKSEMQLSE